MNGNEHWRSHRALLALRQVVYIFTPLHMIFHERVGKIVNLRLFFLLFRSASAEIALRMKRWCWRAATVALVLLEAWRRSNVILKSVVPVVVGRASWCERWDCERAWDISIILGGVESDKLFAEECLMGFIGAGTYRKICTLEVLLRSIEYLGSKHTSIIMAELIKEISLNEVCAKNTLGLVRVHSKWRARRSDQWSCCTH